MKKNIYASIDLETTGFDPTSDSIIEVGLVKYNDDGIIGEYSSLVKFDGELSDFVSRLTGIQGEDLARAPEWLNVRRELVDYLADIDVVVGHNVDFDLSFLQENNIDLSDKKKMDTHYLSGMFFTNEDSYSLEGIHRKYIGNYDAHRALGDAKATLDVFGLCIKQLKKISDITLLKISGINQKSNWVYGSLFERELQQRKKRNDFPENRRNFSKDCQADAGENINLVNSESRLIIQESALKDYLESWQKDGCQLLAVSDRVFFLLKNILDEKIFVDTQSEYLCRLGLRKIFERVSLSKCDVAIMTKILLRVDKGFWDGYLPDLILNKEENSHLDSYRCNCEQSGFNCFFHYRINQIKKYGKKVITRIGSIDSFIRVGLHGVAVWLEDVLMEDGLTYQLQEQMGRAEIDFLIKHLLNCPKLRVDQNQLERKKYLKELNDGFELTWSMLGLLVKSRGITDSYGTKLEMTPSVYQSYDFRLVNEKLQKLELLVNKYTDGCGICDKHIRSALRIIWGLAGKKDRVASLKLDDDGRVVVYSSPVFFKGWVDTLIDCFGGVILLNREIFIEGKYYARNFFSDSLKDIKFIESRNVAKVELIRNYGYSMEALSSKIDFSAANLFLFPSKFKALQGLEGLHKVFSGDDRAQIFDVSSIKKGVDFKAGVLVCSMFDLSYLALKIRDFDSIFLESLPFDPPGSLLIGHRSIIFGEANFDQYYVMRMLSRVKFVAGLLKDKGKLYLADSRLDNRSYGKRVLALMNN